MRSRLTIVSLLLVTLVAGTGCPTSAPKGVNKDLDRPKADTPTTPRR